jgi:hypothetical protein
MKTAIKALFESKKFIVFLTGTISSAAVLFAGLEEAQAAQLADRIMYLSTAYIAGQGVADLGKGIGTKLKAAVAEPAPAPKADADAVAGA